jgi:hypothetical protein
LSVIIAASAGAAAGGILFLVTYIPFFFIGTTDRFPLLSAGTKAGCSILNNLAMGIGCWTLASFESSGWRRHTGRDFVAAQNKQGSSLVFIRSF